MIPSFLDSLGLTSVGQHNGAAFAIEALTLASRRDDCGSQSVALNSTLLTRQGGIAHGVARIDSGTRACKSWRATAVPFPTRSRTQRWKFVLSAGSLEFPLKNRCWPHA